MRTAKPKIFILKNTINISYEKKSKNYYFVVAKNASYFPEHWYKVTLNIDITTRKNGPCSICGGKTNSPTTLKYNEYVKFICKQQLRKKNLCVSYKANNEQDSSKLVNCLSLNTFYSKL